MPGTKTELRALVRASRSAQSGTERNKAQVGLTTELVKLATRVGARRIAAFLPTHSEPPIGEFLDLAHAQGITILTPRAHADGTMTWVEFGPERAQHRTELGVPEIVEGEGISSTDALANVDLILLPAAAVDTQGTRLGWGKGFYDRALSSVGITAATYAVVFDDEVMDSLPSEPHDQPVSGAITPTRSLDFA